MTAEQMWECYSSQFGVDAPYEAWAFGDDADTLAELVLSGKKTATASLYLWYEYENEPLPEAGQYSVVLNSYEEAVCVICTEHVFVTPFRDVDETQAWREGEGTRSLAYWRRVHERFFRHELEQAGLDFNDDMKVVCEEFRKVFP